MMLRIDETQYIILLYCILYFSIEKHNIYVQRKNICLEI